MKQLKSRHQDLREIFELSIVARHIAEFNLQVCGPEEEAKTTRERMRQKDFDVLPLEEDGRISGYVEQSRLVVGKCKEHLKAFDSFELIVESEPLIQVLEVLKKIPRVFVQVDGAITGIITRGDLQKVPVRMLIFGIVSLLEMQFLRIIRACYPDDSWMKSLKKPRLKQARRLFAERKARNEAIDLADCLQFCDKRMLVLCSEELLQRLGGLSKGKCEKLLKSIEKLRDKVAHSQDLVLGSTWSELIELVKETDLLLAKCEEFVSKEL